MWRYFGVLINVITVLIGTSAGMLIRKNAKKEAAAEETNKRDSLSITDCLAVCTVFSAASGLISIKSGTDAFICVLSMILGYIIGYLLRLEDRISSLCELVSKKLGGKGGGEGAKGSGFAAGFISASLIFCVGSMTILGCLESAKNSGGSLVLSFHTILMIKSLLDLVSSFALASKYGASVYGSLATVIIVQSGLVALSSFAQEFLDKVGAMNVISCVGSMILLLLALNLFGLKKIKTADYIPSIFIAIIAKYIIYLL